MPNTTPPSYQQALDDSGDSDTSLLRETIRPRQLDPSAAAAQVLAETTKATSPSFLTADRLVTTVHGQDWHTAKTGTQYVTAIPRSTVQCTHGSGQFATRLVSH